MAGAGVPVPSVDDGAIVVAPQACFKVESHENGVVIHLQRGGPRRSWGLRGLEEMQGPDVRAPGGDRLSGPTGTYVRGVDPQKGFQNNQNTS